MSAGPAGRAGPSDRGTRRPSDATARERVRTDHATTLFVEAGAGTGKTTALVGRIVALVAAGAVPLRELAAITFTEAAAAELRDRVRAALEVAARGGDPHVADPAARSRCAHALDELDDAALSTLHGFAFRILAEFPLEAGLPPGFEVVDEIAAGVAFEQRFREFLEALLADPAVEPHLLVALGAGAGLGWLQGTARVLAENVDRVSAPGPVTPLPPLDVRALDTALATALTHRGACREPDRDQLAGILEEVAQFAERLAATTGDLDRIEVLAEQPRRNPAGKGARGRWSVPVQAVRDAVDEVFDARDGVVRAHVGAALESLRARLVQFTRDDADARRRQGRLGFHDLLVLARRLLRDHPDVRAELARRFRVLLVDEFQDTDPLQIDLAVLLAADRTSEGAPLAGRAWEDIGTVAGRLFFVGDPKQSIYRFRRADLELYARAEWRFDGGRVELTENFRSVPGIVDFVNHVFRGAFDGARPGVQAPHRDLVAHREPLGDRCPVRTFGDAHDARVAEVRALETREAVALARQVVAEGWPVFDPVAKRLRGAHFGDIAFLLPTRAALPALEDALDGAGVPARVESQSLVFATAEVRDLLSVLTAVADPTDGIALVAALRSPGFACRDVELVEYVAAGGRLELLRAAPEGLPPDHPVTAAIAALRDLHERRWWMPVHRLVEAIVRERRLLELATAHRRPRDRWRRLRFLVDRARAWDEVGGDLRGFVDWAWQQGEEGARAVEIVTPEPDDDAVRILTVHGAKGLEFPVVFLVGLNAAFNYKQPAVVWSERGPEVAVEAGQVEVATARRDDLVADDRERDEAERRRLCYVAATRARDHLFVSLHRTRRSNGTYADVFVGHLDGAPREHTEPAADVPASAREDTPAAAPAGPAEHAAWRARHDAAMRAAAAPAAVAATTLARQALPADADPDPGLDKGEGGDAGGSEGDERPPWRRGRAGTALGRAVHATLQTVDLVTGAGLDEIARAQALAEGLPGRERDVRDLAASVLAAPVVQAAAAGRVWREVPVAAEVGGQVLEGFVDLLAETPDGLVVVDYKTDAARSEADVDAAVARYARQGAAYAVALEAALGRPVARCVFVFARRGGAVERELPDLRAWMDDVRAALAAMVTPGARPE